MTIFTITTVREYDGQDDLFAPGGGKCPRTVGYYFTQEKAIECLEKNWMDLNEAGYWPWAVIEKVEEGVYPLINDKQSLWFEYNRENKKWNKIDVRPEWLNKEEEESDSLIGQFTSIG